jgi:hypothetical protein
MQSKKKHMHWQKEQNFKRTRPENNSERNAVMVRGRQLEELAPALLLPLFSSLTLFVLNNNNNKKFSEQE